MTTPSRRRRPALADHEIESVLFAVGCLRSGFTPGEACAAVEALRAAREAGDQGWPRTLDELEAVLPPRGRQLWLLPALAHATTCCPSGAA